LLTKKNESERQYEKKNKTKEEDVWEVRLVKEKIQNWRKTRNDD
jgi:hypothetical protein